MIWKAMPTSRPKWRMVLMVCSSASPRMAAASAAKGRDALNQGRETLTTAIERGREAYQQARRDNA